MPGRRLVAAPLGFFTAALVVCALLTDVPGEIAAAINQPAQADAEEARTPGTVTLAFGGDVHFEGAYADVPEDDDSTIGMADVLGEADLAMVNLESAITERGAPTDKELEDPFNRYWFRTGAQSLDVLERSGVDVVSVANNHGADYGLRGVQDTIRAGEAADVGVVGVGRNDREAFAPHRVSIKGTAIAVHAADASPRESKDALWSTSAGTGPGIAAARGRYTGTLEQAVRRSAEVDDLVVVYMHWGEEGNACAIPEQETLADRLVDAGADVIVGTHAHLPVGSGVKGSAYVSYGLGNFYWYHGRQTETGVLNLTVRGDEVVADEWVPAEFEPEGGAPRPLDGDDREEAVEDWNELRDCTDLEPGPGPSDAEVQAADDVEEGALPAFASTIEEIGPSVEAGMRTFDAARCPVPLSDLRHLTVSYVGFDGRSHQGELVMNADVAEDTVDVFAALYEERFPIRRMLLIDEYGGDDDASMAANNSSGFNCRTVAGTSRFSDHAYGRAIDINPRQNPYVVGGEARPADGAEFVDVDRSEGADARAGVIVDGDVVRREFERLGWEWGGDYPEPDYQHFSLGQ